jgi:two-component system NarL family sensor kinase
MPSPSRSAARSSINPLLPGVALAALAVVLERRRHRAAEQRLRSEASEREAERARLSDRVITAEQDERRRLSVGLHDGPLQSLSGIALMHDAALAAVREGRNEEATPLLESALERERETIQTLRDLSFAIEPVILRDESFEAAVRQLADQIQQSKRIPVTLDVVTAERLGEKAQVALYQVLREAMGQAADRRPTRISVVVAEVSSGAFFIRVEDDGVEERRRASVESIEERARLLGARVSVQTSARGTLVEIELPPYVATADRAPVLRDGRR